MDYSQNVLLTISRDGVGRLWAESSTTLPFGISLACVLHNVPPLLAFSHQSVKEVEQKFMAYEHTDYNTETQRHSHMSGECRSLLLLCWLVILMVVMSSDE